MYIPPAFVENDREVLHGFMEQNSFATLISFDESEPFASHLPLLVERDRGTHGHLIGHFARANSHWKLADQRRVLAIFHGPHAYVSPGWVETTAMVPTWNYVAVHARGVLRVIQEEQKVKDVLHRLVTKYEAGRSSPWSMSEVDDRLIDKLTAAVVGFEIQIDRIEGKWKLSQNHPVERREQIIAGLNSTERFEDALVAQLMRVTL